MLALEVRGPLSERPDGQPASVTRFPKGRKFALRQKRAQSSAALLLREPAQRRPDHKGSLLVISRAELEEYIRARVKEELPQALEARQTFDPMAAARARGVAYKREELSKTENLTLGQAALHAGYSQKWLNTLRQRGEVYALVEEGRARGFRYPAWQFDAVKERLLPVLDALGRVGVQCWGIHAFMTNPSAALEGQTPRAYILDDKQPLPPLLELIARRYVGDQGAQ